MDSDILLPSCKKLIILVPNVFLECSISCVKRTKMSNKNVGRAFFHNRLIIQEALTRDDTWKRVILLDYG